MSLRPCTNSTADMPYRQYKRRTFRFTRPTLPSRQGFAATVQVIPEEQARHPPSRQTEVSEQTVPFDLIFWVSVQLVVLPLVLAVSPW